MFERLDLSKNKTAIALAAGALALGDGGVALANTSHKQPMKKEASAQTSPNTLGPGETIKGIKVVECNSHEKGKKVTLKPNHKNDILGIIYSPDLSKTLLSSEGDHNKNHAVGVLLTEHANKTYGSFIFYELNTGEIAEVSKELSLKNGNQTLFAGGDKSYAYKVNVDPTGPPSNDVIVNYKLLSAPSTTNTTGGSNIAL